MALRRAARSGTTCAKHFWRLPSKPATSDLHFQQHLLRPLRLTSTVSGADESGSEVPTPPTSGQLKQLAIKSSIPLIGFGFMDNVIMILAGDAIDASIGVKLGVSTMAAAGLGNTLSDCVGLFTGDWIESMATKAGVKEPKMSEEQLESSVAKRTKSISSVLGLAFGCILGMFPLAFQNDRKPLYFKEGQEEIYELAFRPHGITLGQFFEIMKEATIREVEADTVLAEGGKPLRKVYMLCRGAAAASGKQRTMIYAAKADLANPSSSDSSSALKPALSDAKAVLEGATLRGSIIGGTCLIDPKLKATDLPYPYEVKTTTKTCLIEWNTAKLHELMEEDKAVESAIVSMLYVDLAESMRRSTRASKQQALTSGDSGFGMPHEHDSEYYKFMADYKIVLQVALADGFVHVAERRLCDEVRRRRGLSEEDHQITLKDLGWTPKEFDAGTKQGSTGAGSTEDLRQRIPEMLQSYGIAARVVQQKLSQNGGDATSSK